LGVLIETLVPALGIEEETGKTPQDACGDHILARLRNRLDELVEQSRWSGG
jgi:hypothetical protein